MPGGTPRPHGQRLCSPLSTWVSATSPCRSHRPSGGSSWQVLRAGPPAFEAAQVGEAPKSFSTAIPCWLCRMDCGTALRLQERRL